MNHEFGPTYLWPGLISQNSQYEKQCGEEMWMQREDETIPAASIPNTEYAGTQDRLDQAYEPGVFTRTMVGPQALLALPSELTDELHPVQDYLPIYNTQEYVSMTQQLSTNEVQTEHVSDTVFVSPVKTWMPTSWIHPSDSGCYVSCYMDPSKDDCLMKGPLFTLMVRQEPIRARMCGFGEKDRRPLSPAPVLQCFVQYDSCELRTSHAQVPLLVVHASLWNEDLSAARDLIATGLPRDHDSVLAASAAPSPEVRKRLSQVLIGSTVANSTILTDDDRSEGTFFSFPDLSIRVEGRYRLRFVLLDMRRACSGSDATSAEILTESFSDVFTVYSAKKFPGMIRSSALSKALTSYEHKMRIGERPRIREQPGKDGTIQIANAIWARKHPGICTDLIQPEWRTAVANFS